MKRGIFIPLFALSFSFSNSFSADLPDAPENSFSVVVIPDTQRYTTGDDGKLSNPLFDRWTDWIVSNLDSQNIALVSHVGDIVDLNNEEQWALARRYMDKLHGEIPYGISVGNHDMTSAGDSTLFQSRFPMSRFSKFDWHAGCFQNPSGDQAVSGNNANSAQLFESEGLKFLALHLECNAPDNVLAWADSMLEKYRDRRAMITTHMDLGPRDKPEKAGDYFEAPKGRMTWKKRHGTRGNTSQQMWEKSFRKHSNLFLICSGDQSRTQAMRMESKGDHGNVVHALLSDYGSGGLRVMRFLPKENQIEVRTWDPVKGELCESTKVVPERDQHQFTLNYKMLGE